MNLHRALTVLLTAVVLVLGLDYVTYARTGDGLVIGRPNSANRTTILQNKGVGPALVLSNRTGAPLGVTSDTRVPSLNADLLDGKHAKDLGVRTTVWTASDVFAADTSEIDFVLGKVPAGRHLLTINGVLTHGGSPLTCALYAGPTAPLATTALGGNADGIYDIGLSAVVTIPATTTVRYECDSAVAVDFQGYDNRPVQFAFTRVDVASTRTATATTPTT